jgi:hypothetical protein
MLTQLFGVFFVNFGFGESWEHIIVLHESITKMAGAVYFVSMSIILTYRLRLSHGVERKAMLINLKSSVSYIIGGIY